MKHAITGDTIMNTFVSTAATAATPARRNVACDKDTNSQPDPALAAIAGYMAAYERSEKLMDELEGLERRLYALARRRGKKKAPPGYDPDRLWPDYAVRELDALRNTADYVRKEQIEADSNCGLMDAIVEFANTVPTTAAGAVAMLSFIADRHSVGDIVGGDYEELDEPLEHIVMAAVATFLRPQLS